MNSYNFKDPLGKRFEYMIFATPKRIKKKEKKKKKQSFRTTLIIRENDIHLDHKYEASWFK